MSGRILAVPLMGVVALAAVWLGGPGRDSLFEARRAVGAWLGEVPSEPEGRWSRGDDVSQIGAGAVEATFAFPEFTGPWNDHVVFLGMNAGPTRRATAQLARVTQVTVITDSPRQDQVLVDGRWFDLSSQSAREAFVASLGLKEEDAVAGVLEALEMCEAGARDELAELARLWARGHQGQEMASRLVLAGHSNGDGVWGDNNGSLRLGPLLRLARALPRAAVRIEDAFVTGCYSGGEVTMEQYLLIFPRARTIWAYEAQAPGVDNGATLDQAGWEKATRGRRGEVVPERAAGTGRLLAVWNRDSGYHAPTPPLRLDELRGKVQWMDESFFQPALAGRDYTHDGRWRVPLRITDPHTGLVRQYYSWLVRLTQHRELGEDERAYWVARMHQAIRLLYYGTAVAPRFEAAHRAQIERAYAELRLMPPRFATLSRTQALGEIAEFGRAARAHSAPSPIVLEVLDLLERGLRDLDPALIPDGWV